VGDSSAYPLLEPDARGTATATLQVELDPDAKYYINLHTSPDDLDTIVGCGDLTKTS